MLNTRGEVIGLVTGTLDGGRSCYALPVSALRRVTEDLSTVGRYQAAWIGLLAGRRPEGDDAPGLPIYRIFSNSPAARAGVAVGDRLLRLGDIQVATPFDVVRGSFLIRAGQPVNITVSRMGASRDLTVAAELRPVSELPEPLRRLTAQTNAIGVQVDLR
jgi:S1-C subfamily serine protease